MKKGRIARLAAIALSAAIVSGIFLCGSASAQAAPLTRSLTDMVNDFQVKADKYYNSTGFSTNHYKYTEDEVKMLAIVIHLEVRGSSMKAKIAVGDVVMNRVLAPGYPGKTIKEVVTRPNQFAYRADVKPNGDCVQAAREVLEHEVWVVPQNTYFFRATKSTGNWGTHKYYAKIDSTTFYTETKYAGRYKGTAIPPSLYHRAYKWPQYGCAPSKQVRKLQIMLKALGYDRKLVTDGYFGPGTKTAVIAFQKANGLTQDGIAGPRTLTKLISKYGTSKYLRLG
jgi:hypothetical protein